MIGWRFDQGRLDYFQFDEIKTIAKAIAEADGVPKPKSAGTSDALRAVLKKHSPLPFLPKDYTVWRNYKRVMGCQLLASELAGRIVATSLCKALAASPDDFDVDDYLGHFAKRFYYPSPNFAGYVTKGPQVFPVVAVLKLLISRYLTSGQRTLSLSDIAGYLIGNQVTGLEPLNDYGSLKKTSYKSDANEERQVRELARFVSQFSFLKWRNPNLLLEISSKAEAFDIERVIQPVVAPRNPDANQEILSLGGGFKSTLGAVTIRLAEPIDVEFTEGNKVRVTHLRTERSAELRNFYFANAVSPEICDMCKLDTPTRYPWVKHVIELHHLLPLGSPIRVETGKSSIKDLVGLCPTCHRATHKYYGAWLKGKGQKDFQTYAEAKAIYGEARGKIVMP